MPESVLAQVVGYFAEKKPPSASAAEEDTDMDRTEWVVETQESTV